MAFQNVQFAELERLLKDIARISPTTSADTISRTLNLDHLDAIKQLAIPGEPQEVRKTIHEAFDIYENCMRFDHPRFFGYMGSSPSPYARLGDALVSMFNANAGKWNTSSGPTVIEHTLIRWLASQIGLPPTAGGSFVSGGSIANLTAIVAARDKMLPSDRRFDGVVYLSDQTHISVAKGLRISGFSDHQVRRISTDSQFRMDVDILHRAITEDRQLGRLPFLIIGSCGTTNTGSIDPMHSLADIARDESLWFHVDGAYGASIALSLKHRDLINGVERADSISWDAHKWLFQTYGCGIVLARDPTSFERSFSVDADYLHNSPAADGTTGTDICNISPELSRPSRAISLWFTLRVLGRHRIGAMIDHGFNLASTVQEELQKLPQWEIVSPATGAIVVFRYAPAGLGEKKLDILNTIISKELLGREIAAILTTKAFGRIVLRLCAMNPAVEVQSMTQIIQEMDMVADVVLSSRADEWDKEEI